MNTNLFYLLSDTLKNKLSDFCVSSVFVEFGELNIRSKYDLDSSFCAAIENELIASGVDFEPYFSTL